MGLLAFSCSGESSHSVKEQSDKIQSTPIEIEIGKSEVPVSSPIERQRVINAVPKLKDVSPMHKQQIVAALNLVSSPCQICEGISIANCLVNKVEQIESSCPVLHRLVDRAILISKQESPSTQMFVEQLTHSDLWFSQPQQNHEKVIVEIWFDPNSKAFPLTIDIIMQLDNALLRFRPTKIDNQGIGQQLSNLGWVELKNKNGQKKSYVSSKNELNWKEIILIFSSLANSDGALWRNKAFTSIIQQNQVLQQEIGVRSTPTWFVDGFRLRGLQSPHQLQRVIDLASMDKK